MNKDYDNFLNSNKKTPGKLSDSVLAQVESSLNPDFKLIFAKLTIIQGFVGFITMLFCPQFSFSLTNNHDLFHYFHYTFGSEICMVICGSIFLGSGAIFSSYLLKEGEVNKIKQSRFLYYMALSIVAVSVFLIFGADIYFNLLFFWLVGAIVGGMSLFEINRLIRKKLAY